MNVIEFNLLAHTGFHSYAGLYVTRAQGDEQLGSELSSGVERARTGASPHSTVPSRRHDCYHWPRDAARHPLCPRRHRSYPNRKTGDTSLLLLHSLLMLQFT